MKLCIQSQAHSICGSARLGIALLLFACCVVNDCAWASFNFSIACMVNATYLRDSLLPSADNKSNNGSTFPTIAADYGGTLMWDRPTQAFLLSAVAWGSVVLTFPAGYLLQRFGAKIVFTFCSLTTGVACCVLPSAVYWGHNYVFILRFLHGLLLQIIWPVVMVSTLNWFPRNEFSMATSWVSCGFLVGTWGTMSVSGITCSTLGWPAVFYIAGGLVLLLTLLWNILYTNKPQKSWFTSRKEFTYINSNSYEQEGTPDIPWRKIVTSPAVLSLILCNISMGYCTFFFSNFLATYLKEVLRYDVSSNGLMSALPYVLMLVGRILSGWIADKCDLILTATASVKIFALVSQGIPSLVVLSIAWLEYRHASLIVGLIAGSHFFWGFTVIGYIRATCMLAPKFTPIIAALTSMWMSLMGIVGPYATGAMIPNGTLPEWQRAFMAVGLVSLAGPLVFAVFGSGKLQAWAGKEKTVIETTAATELEKALVHSE